MLKIGLDGRLGRAHVFQILGLKIRKEKGPREVTGEFGELFFYLLNRFGVVASFLPGLGDGVERH